MLLIKRLSRPTRLSGKRLKPGEVSEWDRFGVRIVNVGAYDLYVDSVSKKRKKKK